MSTEWSMNSDIYDIAKSVRNLQKRYIEDEDETTLSLGVFGFVADTESKKIQTSAVMTGQLGNEMFPTRALLTKNVLTHAAYNNIEGINARPAQITATICIKLEDIENNINSYDEFFIDCNVPIYIENYEFHFDYDVKIKRKKINGNYSYSAQYIVNDENDNPITNRLTNIRNPYLKQPFILNIGNIKHLAIQATLRQYTIEEIKDTMLSDSIIENKSYTFQFENQMADFIVVVNDNGTETELTPYLYGSSGGKYGDEDENYCWYLYISEDTIRLTFDSKSYIPGLNSQIYIKSYTTLGAEGNFEYLNIDQTSEGVYVDLPSTSKYKYKNNMIVYLVAVTDSVNGSDRKTKEQLQKLIPKAAMARGSITTETDVMNYFNLIDTPTERLVMQKKVDNQLERIWYGYFLLKDDENNIIPTNTINVALIINNDTMVLCNDGRYILPAGSVLKYDPTSKMAIVIDESKVPELYSDAYYNDGYYYYMTVYNLALSVDPLFVSSYLSINNYQSYFLYDYVNENSDVQFIANRFHFVRNLLIDKDQYIFSFNIAQSINDSEFAMYTEEVVETIGPDDNVIEETLITQNVRVILVIYNDNGPYRWMECDLYDLDEKEAIYYFSANITTNNHLDDLNRLQIDGMYEAGTNNMLYGYIDETVKASIYILANIVIDPTVEYPRRDLDNIAPGYEDFTVTNIYSCVDGLNFFDNYTAVINNRVEVADPPDDTVFYCYGVPVVGKHYMRSDIEVKYLIEEMKERKAYIDYCLELIENSMNVDFKFFNTYGPSVTYTLEDKETLVGSIDITLKFKLSLKADADATTKNDVLQYIKNYIEDLNDIGDFHAPNLIRDVINDFENRINFIEFVGFNHFDEDDQHIVKMDVIDPTTVPEFINVRNTINEETNEIEPIIEIELV